MHAPELALDALVAWSAIGLVGVAISWRRGERSKARRGIFWILGIGLAYFAVLLTVSFTGAQRHLALGQEECFGSLCFAVSGSEELPGFVVRGPNGPGPRERLVRVSIRVLNRAPSGVDADPLIRATLVDSRGRTWYPVPGLSGVRLNGPMVAGHTVLSQPVFRVDTDAAGLSLVLSKGPWQPGLLWIGDTDSWRHRHTTLNLHP